MDIEKVNEIIKSLALGLSTEQVAVAENIELSEIEQLLYDNADEVASKKEYFNQMGRL